MVKGPDSSTGGSETRLSAGSTGMASGGRAAGTSAGASISGGTTAVSNKCPTWPTNRLMPFIGPQFYGPNPGPCTAETSYTSTNLTSSRSFDYSSDGLVLRAISDGVVQQTYAYDDRARVTSVVDVDSGTTTYEYGDGFVVSTTGTNQRFRYELDSLGYVTSVIESNTTDGTIRGTYRYEYKDCLMTAVAFTPSGGTEQPYYSDIAYDQAGRMIRRTGPKLVTNFGYKCWK